MSLHSTIFRRVQKQIRSDSGIPSIPCISPLGNVFFMTILARSSQRIRQTQLLENSFMSIQKFLKTASLAKFGMHKSGAKSMDLDALSPMYDAGSSHYYVNEIACLKNGKFVVPIRWVKFRGKIYADAFSVTFNDKNEATVVDSTTVLVSANELCNNYLDLQDQHKIPTWSAVTIAAGHPERMPNPKRAIAKAGRCIIVLLIISGMMFSGNRSKSWNKHWNAYMTHRNLPRKLLQ
ncbi:hypothetical protein B0H14DRAFT_2577461 [Mycena olivaceomarginata]|nr:hypothetical protein B0H14DRAFT_2577461 [Mycena olivaceomarginata]